MGDCEWVIISSVLSSIDLELIIYDKLIFKFENKKRLKLLSFVSNA